MDLFERLYAHIEAERPVVMATVVAGPDMIGRKAIVRTDGQIEGDLGVPDIVEEVSRDARELLGLGQSDCRRYERDGKAYEVFFDAYPVVPAIIIVGAVQTAQSLCRLAKEPRLQGHRNRRSSRVRHRGAISGGRCGSQGLATRRFAWLTARRGDLHSPPEPRPEVRRAHVGLRTPEPRAVRGSNRFSKNSGDATGALARKGLHRGSNWKNPRTGRTRPRWAIGRGDGSGYSGGDYRRTAREKRRDAGPTLI